jgi:N-formylglutamate deformylase
MTVLPLDYTSAMPVSVFEPVAPACPLLFDSPHSGFVWPADFRTAASEVQIKSTWDAYVDELWSDAPACGATLVAAHFSRAYIDANRAVNDIDPALLAAPWPGALATTDYSRRGMGLIRRFALPGVAMYDRLLSVEEVRARIDLYYRPYRLALRDALEAIHVRHGTVWHFNCHSMKSRGNDMNTDSGAVRPDFVVSDQLGRTADPALTQWVADYFSGRGFSVAINDPYRGGDLVGTFGAPERHRHSIQIEINRALYMDEARFTRGPEFGRIRTELAGFIRTASARVRTQAPAI